MIIHATRPRAAGAAIPAEGFLRHRGLLLVAAGGAIAEAGLLTLLAPGARPVAPDPRWLTTGGCKAPWP